nr:hypothetical protein [uncultured Lichenicoccus sp.]
MPTILDMSGFDFTPRAIGAGFPVAPPRPPACLDPTTEVADYTNARDDLAKAQARVAALADDLRAAEFAVVAVDAAKAALSASMVCGAKPPGLITSARNTPPPSPSSTARSSAPKATLPTPAYGSAACYAAPPKT